MSLLVSCPNCLNLFPRSLPLSTGPFPCPVCREPIAPADDALAEKTVWFVLHGSHRYGPFILSRLQQLVAVGWVSADDQVTRLGAGNWQRAGTIAYLFPAGAPARQHGADDELAADELSGIDGKAPRSSCGIIFQPEGPLSLSDFQILKKLGSGNMGAVYLAHQRSKDRLVAMKMLARHLSVHQLYVDRFFREASVLSRLNHQGLIRFHGIGQDSAVPFFAMEFVDGISTAQALSHLGGRLPVGDAVHIALRCAEALAYAHSLQVIHRDVKPENVMIARCGAIKVTDLGLAKPLAPDLSLTESGIGLGTPHYMAPEQARDAKHADPRSDIYALGGVLYHYLTGRPPWKGDNLIDVQHEKELGIFTAARRLNGDVPRALELILDKALARKPDLRYQDCRALIHDLKALQVAQARLSFDPLALIDAAAPPVAPGQRVQVLLIHDAGDDIPLTQEALEQSGVPNNLCAVTNGPDALAFFRQHGKYHNAPCPGLIILGRGLHDCDCLELLEELRPERGAAAIPVAVLGSDLRSLSTRKSLGRDLVKVDEKIERLMRAVQALAPHRVQ